MKHLNIYKEERIAGLIVQGGSSKKTSFSSPRVETHIDLSQLTSTHIKLALPRVGLVLARVLATVNYLYERVKRRCSYTTPVTGREQIW